jgi:hypothetical protein
VILVVIAIIVVPSVVMAVSTIAPMPVARVAVSVIIISVSVAIIPVPVGRVMSVRWIVGVVMQAGRQQSCAEHRPDKCEKSSHFHDRI